MRKWWMVLGLGLGMAGAQQAAFDDLIQIMPASYALRPNGEGYTAMNGTVSVEYDQSQRGIVVHGFSGQDAQEADPPNILAGILAGEWCNVRKRSQELVPLLAQEYFRAGLPISQGKVKPGDINSVASRVGNCRVTTSATRHPTLAVYGIAYLIQKVPGPGVWPPKAD